MGTGWVPSGARGGRAPKVDEEEDLHEEEDEGAVACHLAVRLHRVVPQEERRNEQAKESECLEDPEAAVRERSELGRADRTESEEGEEEAQREGVAVDRVHAAAHVVAADDPTRGVPLRAPEARVPRVLYPADAAMLNLMLHPVHQAFRGSFIYLAADDDRPAVEPRDQGEEHKGCEGENVDRRRHLLRCGAGAGARLASHRRAART